MDVLGNEEMTILAHKKIMGVKIALSLKNNLKITLESNNLN